jgi:hypothetical protein
VVVCEENRVVFNDLDLLEPVRLFEKGVSRRMTLNSDKYAEPAFALREGRIVSPPVEAAEPLKRQCDHFVWCVETDARPRTDGKAGVAVVKVMEAIQRSLRSLGAPVVVGSDAQYIPPEQNVAGSVR